MNNDRMLAVVSGSPLAIEVGQKYLGGCYIWMSKLSKVDEQVP